MFHHRATKIQAIEALERRFLCSRGESTPVIITPIHGGGCACMQTTIEPTKLKLYPSAETPNYSLKVNFLPAADVSNPLLLQEGYLPDTGGVFDARNDNEYGWNRDLATKTRSRLNSTAPDGRYSTNINMGLTDVWEMAVPNGSYKVRLVAGDAAYTDSYFKYNVEGQLAMDAKPAGASYWVERSITVSVTDGRLTLSSASGASNNKLAYLMISNVPVQDPGPTLEWSAGSVSLPFHRVENGAVQIGSKLYIMGGFLSNYNTVSNSFQVYDFTTGGWTTKSNMPGTQTHFALATDGSRFIYKMAGQYGPLYSTSASNEGWKYDTQTGVWTRIANLPVVRFGGAMAYLNGKLHYWGGDDASRSNARADHWTLDLNNSNAIWQTSVPIPLPGDHLSHAVLNGKIYSIGGEHDHGNAYVQHDFVYAFDPVTNVWTRKADMPTPASHFEAGTFAYDGYIWAIGGQVDHKLLSDEVRVYDPQADRWSVATRFPEKRKGGTTAIWQGKAYYISGDSASRGTPGLGVPKGSWAFQIPDLSLIPLRHRPLFDVLPTPERGIFEIMP